MERSGNLGIGAGGFQPDEAAIHGLFNAFSLCHKPMNAMTRLVLSIGLALSAALPLTAAEAQSRRGDQDSAYDASRKGQVMPLHRIEAMVVPRYEASGATYLRASPEFDEERVIYRLKFQRDYKVFWIEVDARNGREVGRSGR